MLTSSQNLFRGLEESWAWWIDNEGMAAQEEFGWDLRVSEEGDVRIGWCMHVHVLRALGAPWNALQLRGGISVLKVL